MNEFLFVSLGGFWTTQNLFLTLCLDITPESNVSKNEIGMVMKRQELYSQYYLSSPMDFLIDAISKLVNCDKI